MTTDTATGRDRGAARLLGGASLVLGATVVLVAMCALILGVAGTGEHGIAMGTRATARSSLILFVSAFAASSLRVLWRTPATAWLLANRRYLGLSFAVSHGLHAIFIALYARTFATFELEPLTLVFGGLAYVFVVALAATSSDRAVAWLGGARWRRLHRVGSYYIWFIFAVTLLPDLGRSPLYVALALLVLAPVALRAAAWRAARSRAAQAA